MAELVVVQQPGSEEPSEEEKLCNTLGELIRTIMRRLDDIDDASKRLEKLQKFLKYLGNNSDDLKQLAMNLADIMAAIQKEEIKENLGESDTEEESALDEILA